MKWGAHLGETFVFHFVLCEACFSSPWELASALSCLLACTCDLVYRAVNSAVYFASLETVSNYLQFCVCVSNRKTPEMTAELWSTSFPTRADSPSRTPFPSFLMHRKFCYLQALQKMRFEPCFQLGASKSLSLLYSFGKYPSLEMLNLVASFYHYILRIFL